MTADQLKQMSDDVIERLGKVVSTSSVFKEAVFALQAQQSLITRLESMRDAMQVLIGEHIKGQREAEGRMVGLFAALQEAVSLRVKLYCNGCDDCNGPCTGKPWERDPYAKKWSAALAATEDKHA